MISEEKLKEEFEQWAREYGLDTGRLVHGAYRSFATAASWEAYKMCYEKHGVGSYYKGILNKAKEMQNEVIKKAKEVENEKE